MLERLLGGSLELPTAAGTQPLEGAHIREERVRRRGRGSRWP